MPINVLWPLPLSREERLSISGLAARIILKYRLPQEKLPLSIPVYFNSFSTSGDRLKISINPESPNASLNEQARISMLNSSVDKVDRERRSSRIKLSRGSSR